MSLANLFCVFSWPLYPNHLSSPQFYPLLCSNHSHLPPSQVTTFGAEETLRFAIMKPIIQVGNAVFFKLALNFVVWKVDILLRNIQGKPLCDNTDLNRLANPLWRSAPLQVKPTPRWADSLAENRATAERWCHREGSWKCCHGDGWPWLGGVPLQTQRSATGESLEPARERETLCNTLDFCQREQNSLLSLC